MANIVLRNGWDQPATYKNVASVTFQTDVEGVMATYYENGSGGSGGLGAQANWLQNDSQAADYIKNRPFYSSYTLLITPTALDFKEENVYGKKLYGAILGQLTSFAESKYTVVWGEDLWFCDVVELEGAKYLGNTNLLGITATVGNQPPFVAFCEDGLLTFYTEAALALNVGLGGPEEIHRIDSKYLPENMMAGADWEAEEGQPGFIANKPTTLGLDIEQLQKYLTDNLYVTQGYVTAQLTKIRNEIPSIVVDKIDDILVDYAKIEWVESEYTPKSETENLSNRVKTIEENYVNKTTFKTLEDTVTALQKALTDYKAEVEKTYATKTELADSQADWDVEDENIPAAIKNKPFGIYPDIIPITDELAPAIFVEVEGGYQASLGVELDASEKYTVLWNDKEIACEFGTAKDGITLNSDGTITVAVLPEEEIKIGLRLTDNVYRLDTKFLKKDEILEGMASQKYVQSQINAIPQSDWEQNSVSHKGYIKNRPFYTDDDNIKNQKLTFSSSSKHTGRYSCQIPAGSSVYYKNGDTQKTYNVVWDGRLYENCVCREVTFRSNLAGQTNTLFIIPNVIGNPELWDTSSDYYQSDMKGKGLPFVFALKQNWYGCGINIDDTCITTNQSGTSHTIRVYATDVVHKIDTKYLPDTVVATPNWNAEKGSAGYIDNKPTIPDAQVNADWSIEDEEDIRCILNKPEIPQAPVQPDWNETDSEALSYIKNLPFVLRDPGSTSENWDFFVAHEGATYVVKNHEVATDFIVTDWEEKNPLSRNYIINKPFGENPYLFDGDLNKISTYYEDTGIGLSTFATVHPMPTPKLGKMYEIVVNDILYRSVAKDLSKVTQTDALLQISAGIYFGNASYLGEENPNTGEQYCVAIAFDESNALKYYQCYLKSVTDPGTINLRIREYGSVKKIDKKYLPDECFSGGASSEQLSALEKLVQAQAELINQMQQQLQDLTQRVERLEQGYTPPSGPGASVNGDTLEVEGGVADEILTIQGGAVSNETLVLSGGSGTQAVVDGEELTINGLIADEILNLGSGTVIGETLGLTGDINTVIEEMVSTTGTINNDILSSSGVVTADETWEVD